MLFSKLDRLYRRLSRNFADPLTNLNFLAIHDHLMTVHDYFITTQRMPRKA
jgi:hypothetical protein